MQKHLIVALISGVLLSACNGASTPQSKAQQSNIIKFDNAGTIPVLTANAVNGVYVHNNGTQTVSNIQYEVDNRQITLLNPQECGEIEAGKSCYLQFKIVNPEKQGSFLISAYSQIKNKPVVTQRVMNYQQVTAPANGVFFSSDVNSDFSDTDQYATFYAYAGGADKYNLESLVVSSELKNVTTDNPKTIQNPQVVAIEIKSDSLNLSGGKVSLIAADHTGKKYSTSAKLGSISQAVSAPLTTSLVAPLDLGVNSSGYVYLYNTGLKPLMLTNFLPGENLTLDDKDEQCELGAWLDAGISCKIYFKVNNNAPRVGNSTILVDYTYDKEQNRQLVPINWYSPKSGQSPILQVTPNKITNFYGQEATENFAIANIGDADLQAFKLTPITSSSPTIKISEQSNDCGDNLAAGVTCHYTFKLFNSEPGLDDILQFKIQGTYLNEDGNTLNYILKNNLYYDSIVEQSIADEVILDAFDNALSEFKQNPVIPPIATQQGITETTVNNWQEIVNVLINKNLDFYYDGIFCTSPTDPNCPLEFKQKLIYPLQQLQKLLYAVDTNNINLFSDPAWQTSFGKLVQVMVKYGDTLRANLRYPIDHSHSNVPLLSAIYVDNTLYFSRKAIVAPGDMGAANFGETINHDIPAVESTITVDPGLHDRWIQDIGLSLPGIPVTIQRIDHESTNLSLRFTSEIYDFKDDASAKTWVSYSQPFNLGYYSQINLPVNGQITYISPYPLNIVLEAMDINKPTKFQVKITNLSSVSPVISMAEAEEWPLGREDYFKQRYNEIEAAHLPWVSILMDDFHLEEPLAFLKSDINEYAKGNASVYFVSLMDIFMRQNEWMMGYSQAAAHSIPQDPMIMDFCNTHNLDCQNTLLHPNRIIRIENDYYDKDHNPHGGGGWEVYMGNCTEIDPYDWCINHEVGHAIVEQQYGGYHLMFPNTSYGDSLNNVLPSHLEELYFVNHAPEGFKFSHGNDESVFQLLKKMLNNAESIYWSNLNNLSYSQRLSFYHQLVILNSENKDSLGWRIYPLLFKISRLFDTYAADENNWNQHKNDLGFSLFSSSEAKKISPEDFTVVALSWVTNKDYVDYFKMWGLNPSNKAIDQVKSFNFPAQPLVFNKKYYTVSSDSCILNIKADDWNKCDYTPATELDGAKYKDLYQ